MTRRVKGTTSFTSGRTSDEDTDEDAAYSIGYGKPPARTRFKPGTSGNPNGRPKGKRNLAADLRNVYTGEVVIREGEKTRRVTRLEALLRKQIDRAFRGDARETLTACKIADKLGVLNAENETLEWELERFESELRLLTDEELKIVQRIFKRSPATGGS